jgi:hypothetical protein
MGCLQCGRMSLAVIAADPAHDSPMFVAAAGGDVAVVMELALEASMATTETVEADIMRYNDTLSAEALEALPAPVRACVARSPVSKMTPVQVAAANNHLECLRALYGVFAVRDSAAANRESLLWWAARHGNADMMALLVGNGGSVPRHHVGLAWGTLLNALRSPNPASAAVMSRLTHMHYKKLGSRDKQRAKLAGVYEQLKAAHVLDWEQAQNEAID